MIVSPVAPSPAKSLVVSSLKRHRTRSSDGGGNGASSNGGAPTTMKLSLHSTMAGDAIQRGNYREAIELYRVALGEYLKGSPSVVELVNAAATCFNLGALSKKLQHYPQASEYFLQAEQLYKSCVEKVKRSRQNQQPQQQQQSSTSQVCLYQLIVETIQARAHLHYKYLHRLEEAIECHEEALDALEQQANDDRTVMLYKIQFVSLGPQHRSKLLLLSLQNLGKLYVERGDLEDGLIAYQEALGVLQEQQQQEHRQAELVQILQALADIYMEKQGDTLGVPQLQLLARLQEDFRRWNPALSCWERVLYLQSQQFGEASVQVADALCQLARVMMLQGNQEGALDLYHAAIQKYRLTKTPLPREAVGNTTNIFCQLQLQDEALEYLQDLNSSVSSQQQPEEAAWVLCQRGRIYLEQGRLDEASQCLCQSAQMLDDDDYVFQLLQKLEFLQQRRREDAVVVVAAAAAAAPEKGASSTTSSIESTATILELPSTSHLDLPLESIMEDDDETSTVTSMEERRGELTGGKLALDCRAIPSLLETIQEQRQEKEDEEENIDNQKQDYCEDDEQIHFVIQKDEVEMNAAVEAAACTISCHPTHLRSPSTDEEDEDEFIPITSIDRLEGEGKANVFQGDDVVPVVVTPDRPTTSGQQARRTQAQHLPPQDSDEAPPKSHSPPVSGSSVTEVVDDLSATCSKHDNNAVSDSTLQLSQVPAVTRTEVETSSDQNTEDPLLLLPMSMARQFNDASTSVVESYTTEKPPRTMLYVDTTSCSLQLEEEPTIRSTSARSRSFRNDKSPLQTPQQSNSVKSPLSDSGSKFFERQAPNEEILTKTPPPNRGRFAKAFGIPFLRQRSKNRLLSGLNALDEEREVKAFPPTDDYERSGESFDDAPVPYIAMRKNENADEDNDDDESQVSQITFKIEEQATAQKTNQDGQWWWGVTAEGLEGWFPTSYVHQAVEAAEGFLSAKSIHEQKKSRPLDFDSDEESEKETSSVASKTINEESSIDGPDIRKGKNNKSLVESSLGRRRTLDAVAKATRPTTLASQIEQKQAHLEQQSSADAEGHLSEAITLFELAVLRSKNGEVGEALCNCQQALQIQNSSENIPGACKTLILMAEIHSRTKHYDAALACYDELQKLQEATFGYYHEDVANTLNRKGNVLARQGEFDIAMDNHKEALRILKKYCGEEVKNPLVSQTLIQIGAVYYKERNSLKTIQTNRDGYSTFIEGGMLEVIGRAHEERGSYRMAIAFFEEKLQCLDDQENSDDLEQVAETLNSLGMLSCRAGLYLEAIDYYDRALGIQMKLGCDVVQLAMAKVLAGSVQFSLGHFMKALKLFEDALRTLRDKVGKEQETVAATLFHMGVVRVALYDYDNAKSNLKEALRIQKKLLGGEHPATLRTRRELGNLLAAWESEIDFALSEYNAVLEIQKRIHGERHPNVSETLHCIGCAQARKGEHKLALRTLEDCYNMRLEFLGMDHPLQASTLHEIAKIQLERGRLKKAVHICDSALLIRKDSLSENHVDVATATATKASCLVAKGDFAEANKLFLEAHSIAREAVGVMHPTVADIQVQVGTMHLRKCHFDEAAEAIKNALDIYRASGLDDNHRGVMAALKELERVERAEMLCV